MPRSPYSEAVNRANESLRELERELERLTRKSEAAANGTTALGAALRRAKRESEEAK